MTLSQFEQMILTFGPVVDEWPAALMASALDCLRSSDEARDLFAHLSIADMNGVDGARTSDLAPQTLAGH